MEEQASDSAYEKLLLEPKTGPSVSERRLIPTVKVVGIVASEARTAVVFRRGPAGRVRMLRWDLRTDELIAGQWLVGRVYERACGLSPDGELLVYYARKGRLKFTAVSRPPYFTALAYWEDGWPPTAGGFFDGNRRLVIGQKYDSSYRAGDIPADFEVASAWDHFFGAGPFTSWNDVIPQSRERNQGWCAHESQVYAKPNPARAHRPLRLERESTEMGDVAYRLVDDSANQRESPALTRDLGPLDWADWDHDGSLLYSREGCLYRERMAATSDAQRLEALLVADLRDQVFENILPSKAARTWPRGPQGRQR